MQRGIGKQLLFETPEDYRYYLKIIEEISKETGVTVCTYCLMGNHTHLLLYDKKERIPQCMKIIGICYAQYFNKKYERVGHLFQGRYHSETIESDSQLKRAARYILNNPQKAGICHAKKYQWSSYQYYGKGSTFVDMRAIESLMGTKKEFVAFLEEANNDTFLEYETGERHDDKWALGVIHSRLNGQSGTSLQSKDRKERDRILHELKVAGLSIRQLERLTGINRGVIQRA